MVEYTNKAKKYVLTPKRKHAKAVARRNKSSLVTEVFKDNTTKQYVIKRIGNIVRKELFTMCSEKTGSILSSKHVSDLKEFTWDKLLTELDSHAPVLHSILKMCTQTRRRRPNRSAVIGMCVAILLRYQHVKMNLAQRIVSVILYAGDCSKQVIKITTLMLFNLIFFLYYRCTKDYRNLIFAQLMRPQTYC